MNARRMLVAILVLACAVNCATAPGPRPSPAGNSAPTPEECQKIIARGGSC